MNGIYKNDLNIILDKNYWGFFFCESFLFFFKQKATNSDTINTVLILVAGAGQKLYFFFFFSMDFIPFPLMCIKIFTQKWNIPCIKAIVFQHVIM